MKLTDTCSFFLDSWDFTLSDALTGFTLKLTSENRKQIQLLTAEIDNINFQYELLDIAVAWASDNSERLMATANPKQGSYRSYYLKDTVGLLEDLEKAWDCNTTRALHSAIISFLKAHPVTQTQACLDVQLAPS